MDIVVLLKQVPATESMIRISDDKKRIETRDLKWVVNPYDEFAVEEALRIRDAQGGTVTVVSLGTDKAKEAIRTALAMGADKGVLINDTALEAIDGLGTAKVLSTLLKDLPHDLIICGQRAVDDDGYLVGPAVAELLGIPHVSYVIRAEMENGKMRCHSTVEGGVVVLEADLPALFTAQRGLNEPRFVPMTGIMKAKKKPIDVKTLNDIGLNPESVVPASRIAALKYPEQRKGGKMVEGETAAEKAKNLVRLLRDEAKVI